MDTIGIILHYIKSMQNAKIIYNSALPILSIYHF